MTFDRSIKAQYLGFEPITAHAGSCSRAGSDVWETSRHRQSWSVLDGSGARDETTIRALCSECGVVAYERFTGLSSFEVTSTQETGYGLPAERVAGLWLHAGPRFGWRDDRGPEAFYVTRVKDRPCTEDDLVGAVSWYTTHRGAIRWQAKTGERTADDFKSRRAAVQWITEQGAPS